MGSIQSLDLAAKRDVLATASRDLSVRVWNFNPIRCEACHQTTDVPESVGIHPSGYELLVGYYNKVESYNIVDGLLLATGYTARARNLQASSFKENTCVQKTICFLQQEPAH